MADSKNILNPEEEKKTLTEKPATEQSTGIEPNVDGSLNDTTALASEVKVRHDTVKWAGEAYAYYEDRIHECARKQLGMTGLLNYFDR